MIFAGAQRSVNARFGLCKNISLEEGFTSGMGTGMFPISSMKEGVYTPDSKRLGVGEMASITDSFSGTDGSQTTPGLTILKKLWNIEEKKARSDVVEKVSTDICNVPSVAKRMAQREQPP